MLESKPIHCRIVLAFSLEVSFSRRVKATSAAVAGEMKVMMKTFGQKQPDSLHFPSLSTISLMGVQ
jgi:hypothetical protein